MINTKYLKNILNAKKKYNIHFVGAGGVSMFNLAIYVKKLGHCVTGSDVKKSQNIEKLKSLGINVQIGHDINYVKQANIVIYSFATENCEEVAFAKNNNMINFSRAEFLGAIISEYKTKICVSGAHGKTTTTALIYTILKNAGKNVNLHLGGVLTGLGNQNLNVYNKDIIVCEACEYKDAFLKLKPNIAVVTNLASEHLDYFKNFENIKKSFNKFSKNANVLICPNLQALKNKNKITFGENGDIYATNIKMNKNGTYNFDVYKNDVFYHNININLIGEHNIKNALCAIAVCDNLKINKEIIKKSLAGFMGVERRYQILNTEPLIVHDYAHHPDEISAVISETKKFYKGKLLIVFQPHTYSRTKTLMPEFVDCLKNEECIIFKTFSAREKYIKEGSAKTLSKHLKECKYFNSKKQLIGFLKQKLECNYAILLLGAGDINIIAKNIAKLC